MYTGIHVAVYVYVLREQGLFPVSESEFSLDPEEPNIHLFHRTWLSWERSLLFTPRPRVCYQLGSFQGCLVDAYLSRFLWQIVSLSRKCFVTFWYGETYLYHCMKAKVNVGCFTSSHRCRYVLVGMGERRATVPLVVKTAYLQHR